LLAGLILELAAGRSSHVFDPSSERVERFFGRDRPGLRLSHVGLFRRMEVVGNLGMSSWVEVPALVDAVVVRVVAVRGP